MAENEEKYCQHCGKSISALAEICPKCGVRVMAPPVVSGLNWPDGPKERVVALLLAIFLAFWTWLYTYKVDATKFWLNLALTIVTCGLWSVIAWVWALVDVLSRPESFYTNFPNG